MIILIILLVSVIAFMAGGVVAIAGYQKKFKEHLPMEIDGKIYLANEVDYEQIQREKDRG